MGIIALMGGTMSGVLEVDLLLEQVEKHELAREVDTIEDLTN